MNLHPGLDLPALATRWQASRNLRIEGFLQPEVAGLLVDAVRLQPHTLRTGNGPLTFLYGECTLIPEPACDHPTCAFARWWHTTGRVVIEGITGQRLRSPDDQRVVATHYGKGAYLDAHNDFDGQRAVAYVLGLTRSSWPAEEGGHLEFLGVEGSEVVVLERRAPGFNTLDLFEVSQNPPPHRIPIVTGHHERRAISGWFAQGRG